MSDLAELIAQLESAQEGSRELDGEIWRAVEPEGDWHLFDDGLWCKRDPRDPIAFDPPPKFTTGLDSALSLVPEGWHAIINWRDKLDGSSSVVIHEFPLPCRRIPEKEPFVIAARTAALAVCVAALAALRARQERS